VDLFQFQHGLSGSRELGVTLCTTTCAILGGGRNPAWEGKYFPPIKDSTEPSGQGQRGKEGIVWIREAGIPNPAKTCSGAAKLGFSNDFRAAFAQRKTDRCVKFPILED
jgi:hypothetical protein